MTATPNFVTFEEGDVFTSADCACDVEFAADGCDWGTDGSNDEAANASDEESSPPPSHSALRFTLKAPAFIPVVVPAEASRVDCCRMQLSSMHLSPRLNCSSSGSSHDKLVDYNYFTDGDRCDHDQQQPGHQSLHLDTHEVALNCNRRALFPSTSLSSLSSSSSPSSSSTSSHPACFLLSEQSTAVHHQQQQPSLPPTHHLKSPASSDMNYQLARRQAHTLALECKSCYAEHEELLQQQTRLEQRLQEKEDDLAKCRQQLLLYETNAAAAESATAESASRVEELLLQISNLQHQHQEEKQQQQTRLEQRLQEKEDDLAKCRQQLLLYETNAASAADIAAAATAAAAASGDVVEEAQCKVQQVMVAGGVCACSDTICLELFLLLLMSMTTVMT
jgi:hypothetical protein